MILSRKLIGCIKFPKVKTLEDFPFKCKILKKKVIAIKFNENSTFYRITKGSLTSNKFNQTQKNFPPEEILGLDLE